MDSRHRDTTRRSAGTPMPGSLSQRGHRDCRCRWLLALPTNARRRPQRRPWASCLPGWAKQQALPVSY
eukprot:602146-Alexandrium_andersonii.AAC.1